MGLELGRAVEVTLGNPFTHPAKWRAAAQVVCARAGGAGVPGFALARAVAEVLGAGQPLGKSVDRQARILVSAAQRCYLALENMVGTSSTLGQVRAMAWGASFGASLFDALRLQPVVRDHDVLIVGETGTGKEAVAHAIARASLLRTEEEAPFAALNVAAIPETLIESELFGHVRGAFTGANKTRVGHIRSVSGGCLFLDEVGDLPATAQSKLLRVMETDRVTPVGSDQSFQVDVRYIAATHKDLRAMVARGAFREDLYERLAGQVIRLPALRERVEDLLPIGVRFAQLYLSEQAPEWPSVRRFLASEAARSHRWPGNVRELQNCLRNVMLGADPGLAAVVAPSSAPSEALPAAVLAGTASLNEVEAWYLGRVLERSGNNYALAARALGVDRTTVARKARGRRGAKS